jgi:glycosyltransferase involved in cell wall biosynthesis
LADIVRERQIGLVLAPHDMRSAANALVSLLRNRPALSSAGVAARKTAREMFDRDVLAQQLENVLLSAIGRVERPLAEDAYARRAA